MRAVQPPTRAAGDRGRMRGDRPRRQRIELFRFTVRHSLLFAVIVGLITLVLACVLPGMVP